MTDAELPHTIMRERRDGWGPIRRFLLGKRRCWCGEKHPAGERFYRLRSSLPGYWKPINTPEDAAEVVAALEADVAMRRWERGDV